MNTKTEWDKLTPEQQNGFIARLKKLNGGKFPEPAAPEKWTVERVYDEVKPIHMANSLISNIPTEPAARKVIAFCQLLTCAHWANEGYKPTVYNIAWNWNKLGTVFPLPFPIANKDVYDKFMSIEGIESLLKTFFGIND